LPVGMRKAAPHFAAVRFATLHFAAVLLVVSCRASREPAAATDAGGAAAEAAPLPAQVDWAHVAASVYLDGEDYQESKEVEGQLDARKPALLRLLDRALASIGTPVPADADLVQAIQALRGRVAGAVDYDLPHDAAALADRIAQRAKFPMTPAAKPDLEHGAKVYAQACAACHGANADGHSRISVKMDPPPSDLLHPDRAFRPYDTFARITYGGLETAMPGFGDGLSAQDRWDVVFYLFAVRWPKCEHEIAQLKASELALLSDFDLSARVPYDAIGCVRQRFGPP
jgi:mono/diheme cytochrome c family protein